MSVISGIYQIRNIKNGKSYIGSAVSIKNRFSKHICELKRQRHHSPILQNAWNKHGAESFEFEIIEKTDKKEMLLELEQKYLDSGIGSQYNILRVAGSCFGNKATEKTKLKMSLQKMGENNPNYGKRGADSPLFGRKADERQKKALSEMREGEKNPMYGVTPKHAKLSYSQVREIRTMLEDRANTLGAIANQYGVTVGIISHIRQGRSYRGAY